MRILGCGMAGLLAANMLRRHSPTIYEKQDHIPSNHEALLRFRTETISRITGIPFKKVSVQKAIWFDGEARMDGSLQMANMYSQKVTGKISNRSILELSAVDRYIAPYNFANQLAVSCNIALGCEAIEAIATESHPIISTLPMPMMMRMMGWPVEDIPEFSAKPIWVLTCDIVDPECDVYQTIYFPDPQDDRYRASITGNRLIVEYIKDPFYKVVDIAGYAHASCLGSLDFFGIQAKVKNPRIKEQKYGKIAMIDDGLRKQFILWLTTKHNIYSLGRFATWRNILLDDLVNDITLIGDFITTKDHYTRTLSAARKPNWEK